MVDRRKFKLCLLTLTSSCIHLFQTCMNSSRCFSLFHPIHVQSFQLMSNTRTSTVTASRRSSRIAETAATHALTLTNLRAKIEDTPASTPTPAPSTPKRKRKVTTGGKSPSPSPRKRSPKKQLAPKQILCSSDLATIAPENPWIDLKVPPHELRPSATLTTGQCFNWLVVHDDIQINNQNKHKQKHISSPTRTRTSAWGTHDETEWVSPVQDFVLSIRETPTTTFYRVLHSPNNPTDVDTDTSTITEFNAFLVDYFQLNTPLEPLYNSWCSSDERMSKIAPVIPGVRIIRQNPVECLFSFICSSNNNIPRITKMLSSFRKTYGEKMMDLPLRLLDGDGDRSDDSDGNGSGGGVRVSDEVLGEPMAIYSFPTLDQLKKATEQELRDLGLGYRAKYIIQTRDLLIDSGGEDYLLNLRQQKDSALVQEELLKFSGIGPKVADCVALFSLDQTDAIPVDVHVQRIASRDYDPNVLGQAKSLTPTIYKRVGDLFRDRFEYAGWAHSLMFVAELPSFRSVLPEDVLAEMDAFKDAENARKALEKEIKKNRSPKKK